MADDIAELGIVAKTTGVKESKAELDDLTRSAKAVPEPIKAIEEAAKRAGVSVEEFRARMAATSAATQEFGRFQFNTAGMLSSTAKEAMNLRQAVDNASTGLSNGAKVTAELASASTSAVAAHAAHSNAIGNVTRGLQGHASASGQSTSAVQALREAIGAINPPLNAMGTHLGNLGQYAAAARGGFAVLAASIGGAFIAALESANDKLKGLQERFEALKPGSGERTMKGLAESSDRLGVSVHDLAPGLETVQRLLDKMQTTGGGPKFLFAPGAEDQMAHFGLSAKQLFDDITKLYQVARDPEPAKKAEQFFADLTKAGGLTQQIFDKLPPSMQRLFAEMGHAGGVIGAALDPNVIARYSEELRKLGPSGESIRRVTQGIANLHDQTVALEVPRSVQNSWDALFAAWDRFKETLGESAGITIIADGLTLVTDKLKELNTYLGTGVAKTFFDEFKRSVSSTFDTTKQEIEGILALLDKLKRAGTPEKGDLFKSTEYGQGPEGAGAQRNLASIEGLTAATRDAVNTQQNLQNEGEKIIRTFDAMGNGYENVTREINTAMTAGSKLQDVKWFPDALTKTPDLSNWREFADGLQDESDAIKEAIANTAREVSQDTTKLSNPDVQPTGWQRFWDAVTGFFSVGQAKADGVSDQMVIDAAKLSNPEGLSSSAWQQFSEGLTQATSQITQSEQSAAQKTSETVSALNAPGLNAQPWFAYADQIGAAADLIAANAARANAAASSVGQGGGGGGGGEGISAPYQGGGDGGGSSVDFGENATGGLYLVSGSGGRDGLQMRGQVSSGEVVAIIPPNKSSPELLSALQQTINDQSPTQITPQGNSEISLRTLESPTAGRNTSAVLAAAAAASSTGQPSGSPVTSSQMAAFIANLQALQAAQAAATAASASPSSPSSTAPTTPTRPIPGLGTSATTTRQNFVSGITHRKYAEGDLFDTAASRASVADELRRIALEERGGGAAARRAQPDRYVAGSGRAASGRPVREAIRADVKGQLQQGFRTLGGAGVRTYVDPNLFERGSGLGFDPYGSDLGSQFDRGFGYDPLGDIYGEQFDRGFGYDPYGQELGTQFDIGFGYSPYGEELGQQFDTGFGYAPFDPYASGYEPSIDPSYYDTSYSPSYPDTYYDPSTYAPSAPSYTDYSTSEGYGGYEYGGDPYTYAGDFQKGGRFRVPGHGGPDSVPIKMRVTPGEEVSIAPPGNTHPTNGNGADKPITVNVFANDIPQLIMSRTALRRVMRQSFR